MSDSKAPMSPVNLLTAATAKAKSPMAASAEAKPPVVPRFVLFQLPGGDVLAHIAELEAEVDAGLLDAHTAALHKKCVDLGWVIGSQLCIYTYIFTASKKTRNIIYTSDAKKAERLAHIIGSNVEANRVVRELLRRSNGMVLRNIVVESTKGGIKASSLLGVAKIAHLCDMIPV